MRTHRAPTAGDEPRTLGDEPLHRDQVGPPWSVVRSRATRAAVADPISPAESRCLPVVPAEVVDGLVRASAQPDHQERRPSEVHRHDPPHRGLHDRPDAQHLQRTRSAATGRPSRRRRRLAGPVRRIEQRGDHVLVSSDRGPVRARRVIVAAPPATVLGIDWYPFLPAKRCTCSSECRWGA